MLSTYEHGVDDVIREVRYRILFTLSRPPRKGRKCDDDHSALAIVSRRLLRLTPLFGERYRKITSMLAVTKQFDHFDPSW